MLSGRLALVTGGARGIGKAVCQVLAREGAKVAVADRDLDGCRRTVRELGGQDHTAVEIDVADAASVRDAFQSVLDQYREPPAVVANSAGITADGYLLKMTDENFDRVIDVNLRGTYLVNKTAANLMKQHQVSSGSIVNVSSVIGKTGNVGQANYAASKAGVIGFTKSAAKELGKFGIRVNCICPGFIDTAMTETVPEHLKQVLLMQIPLGTMGLPEDVAETVAFLSSNRAKYVTGAAVDVNGGLL